MAKKEVVKKEKNELASFEGQTWGNEGMDNEDMIIPKIRLTQPMSELVTEGTAQMGEFRDSLNTDVKLGGVGEPLDFVVFSSFKTWWVFHGEEYVDTVPYGPENAHWRKKYEETIDGVTLKRSLLLNFYVLTTKDIEDGVPFPKVLSFKGTSGQAGKKLATFLTMLKAVKMPSAAQVFSLSAKKEQNDKGTFFVMDVTKSRKATTEEVELGKMWNETISQATNVRIDEEPEEQTTEAPVNYAPQATSTTQESIQV